MTENKMDEDKFITYSCKQCLKKITFRIPAKEIENAKFPIKLDNIHGNPPHQLTIFIDDKLQIETFEVKEGLSQELLQKAKTTKFTEEVLRNYGLTDEEIQLHIQVSGMGPVTIGEMARISNLPDSKIREIANNFVEKGFFRMTIGAKEYYQALPPYPALIDQLNSFSDYITQIKEETPDHLQSSFKQFENQAQGVKNLTEFIDYLNSLNKVIADKMSDEKAELEKTLKKLDLSKSIDAIDVLKEKTTDLLDVQFESLDQQVVGALGVFDEIFVSLEKDIDNNIKSFDRKIDALAERLDELKNKLSRGFRKLRLGVVQKVVEDLVQKTFVAEIRTIKESFRDSLISDLEKILANLKVTFMKEMKEPIKEILEKSKVNFKQDFEQPFQGLISNVSEEIDISTKEASKIGVDLKETFTNIVKEFDGTISETQTKITGISDEVLGSFASLRGTFSSTVMNTLEDVLDHVSNRLHLSSLTVEEFWEDAKSTLTQSMKDVWFVRTPEGMRSQINDSVAKAKMRVLIVAPTLSDIEIEPIMELKSHINVRICCDIDTNNPVHKALLDELETKNNVTIRGRDLHNLWGINRDYEEILLGIVSSSDESSDSIDVVGIGSYLDEHIKILVPILEEGWMGSHKDYKTHIKSEQSTPIAKPEKTQPTVSESKKKSTATPIPSFNAETAQFGKTKPVANVIPNSTLSFNAETAQFGKAQPNIAPAPEIKVDPEPEIVSNTQSSQSSTDEGVSSDLLGNIEKMFNALLGLIQTMEPSELAKEIEITRDYIFENKGFSRILNDMKNWASQIKSKRKMDDSTANMLRKKIEGWKESILN